MHACMHVSTCVCVLCMCLSERLHEELQREKDVANKPHMHLHGMSCAAFFSQAVYCRNGASEGLKTRGVTSNLGVSLGRFLLTGVL